MAMKMQIEYDILGRTQLIPASQIDNEFIIKAAKQGVEMQLRAEGVFGEIKHEIVKPQETEDPETSNFGMLHSSGMHFLKEVKDGD